LKPVDGRGRRDGGGRQALAPSPSAAIPALDEQEVEVLRQVGRHWARAIGDREQWRRALPLKTGLTRHPQEIQPSRFGRFVTVGPANGGLSEAAAAEEPETVPSGARRIGRRVHRVILGSPLKSTAIAVERMRKLVALPVLSADALSSVAYGPEAMLAILVLGGSSALQVSLPIAATIAFLMIVVGTSYRQTIRAYPQGGGSYTVASENLGRMPGLLAAAGLIIDYVLTVAVSVAAGMAAVTSAVPSLRPDVVPLGVGVIGVLLAGNLRGVRQAGALFAAPTYAFILAIFLLVAVGLGQAAGHGFHATPPPSFRATEGIGLLLVLRAFASGSTAMTGIEAISNAVPVFRPTEWRNARTTLTWMIGLLVALFVGTIALIHLDGIAPKPNETVLSQLAHRSFGTGPLYAYTQAATAAVLLLAADTSFNDFPRVLFFMARDFQAPRIFLRMGDRLAFSNGIVALALAAAVIFIGFGGTPDPLIPLFAVGVFLAFTLSQAGMVVHWWRRREAHWRKSMVINAVGSFLSAIVFVIAGLTKFAAGAWVAGAGIGLIVLTAIAIRHHYDAVRSALTLHPLAAEIPSGAIAPQAASGARHEGRATDPSSEGEESPEQIRHLTLVSIGSLNLASVRALAYAASLQQPVLALHISPNAEEAERFRDYWSAWGDHLPLEVVISPYRAVVAPMIHHIEALHRQQPDLTLTVILPELVVRHWWHRALHSRLAPRLRRALKPLPKIVITTVPFHLPDRHA
jgi:amino acid transporter